MAGSPQEWEGFFSEEDKATVRAQKLPLHLNRGMCKLKLGKFEDALWDCDRSVGRRKKTTRSEEDDSLSLPPRPSSRSQ